MILLGRNSRNHEKNIQVLTHKIRFATDVLIFVSSSVVHSKVPSLYMADPLCQAASKVKMLLLLMRWQR